jgi:nicotinamide-nucleotide amidase
VNAEIVAVGTELLLGQIANTNAQWMSQELAAIGVDVVHHQVVGDNMDRIVEALRLAAGRADVVIVSGGLGPTEDDITRDAIAAFAGVPLVFHPELEDMLREKFRRWSTMPSMPESNLRQASVPDGARTIAPDRGTAPGLILTLPGDGRLYAVPGVPDEMREMMAGTIVPELAARIGGDVISSRVLRVAGMGESAVAEVLADLFEASVNPTIAYLASMGEVKVRLTAKAPSEQAAADLLAPLTAEILERLGDVVFSDADESLEHVVLRLLLASGRTIACAESLTGGGVGARITAVPGASGAFVGSAVVYTSGAKQTALGVPRAILEGPGAVSEECAVAMAAGALRVFDTDVALALTGAAGPEPHAGAAAGTVWVAVADRDRAHARGFIARGERDRVRRWAEQAGLDLVRRFLQDLPLPGSSLPAG